MAKMSFAKKIAPAVDTSVKSWKIIIADDEPDIHTLTKTVLSDFRYQGRPLEFISTYSGEETFEVIKNNEDIAMVLLDVVMESDDAGLITAKRIREELDNHTIQIVLRTGQPGYAPETDVVVNYAINDYKEKTELTAKKMLTTIITALRSYEILKALEANKRGLQQIINSSEELFKHKSNVLFTQGVLAQLASILKINHDAVILESFDGFSVQKTNDHFKILTTSGIFSGANTFENLNDRVRQLIIHVNEEKKSLFVDNCYIGYLTIDANTANIIYIESYEKLKSIDKSLIEIFCSHSSIALNNIKLNEEMFLTQKTLIEVLGEIVEKRYIDDSNHIRRVAQMSYLLAIKAGLSEKDAELLRMVSPMHDVGKIGISDAILLKPGKLTKEEFDIMKNHSAIGYTLLRGTGKETLDLAALIAYEHHERWDGKGYPLGLKGEESSIYGRITAIIDVYDALANTRCYKAPWSAKEIYTYFEKEKGKQFDPHLTQLFLDYYEEFQAIQNDY